MRFPATSDAAGHLSAGVVPTISVTFRSKPYCGIVWILGELRIPDGLGGYFVHAAGSHPFAIRVPTTQPTNVSGELSFDSARFNALAADDLLRTHLETAIRANYVLTIPVQFPNLGNQDLQVRLSLELA
jgi:hypothetical protein